MGDWNSNCVPLPNFLLLSTLSIATRISILKWPDHVTLLFENLPWLSSSMTLTWALNFSMPQLSHMK